MLAQAHLLSRAVIAAYIGAFEIRLKVIPTMRTRQKEERCSKNGSGGGYGDNHGTHKKKSQKQNKTKKLKNTKNQNKKKSKSICSFIYSEWTQPITDWHGTRYVPDA